MHKPLTWLMRLMALLMIVCAVGFWVMDKVWWLSLLLLLTGGFFAYKGLVSPSPDEVRGNISAAVFVNPHTLAMDADGYRPGEGDIPQQQPAGEIYERESEAVFYNEDGGRMETVENAPERLPERDPSIRK